MFHTIYVLYCIVWYGIVSYHRYHTLGCLLRVTGPELSRRLCTREQFVKHENNPFTCVRPLL